MATFKTLLLPLIMLFILSCQAKREQQFENEIRSINLKHGDVALCGTQEFGVVDFEVTCKDEVKKKFNLATALLHSFEYEDAEKVFARVIEEDPDCAMAYWGVAMSNFHALWAMNVQLDLEKGAKAVALARSLENKSEKESDYIEAIGAFYDDYEKLDHKTRSVKFEKAMEALYQKYSNEKEAAIFYALALNATADPTDKSYKNQRRAGEILNNIYPKYPNHPGVAHYIIHTFDYPELAELGLPAARAYADIAPASAHAQHMPSHIFTRLGLWEESEKSNLKSIEAARCYAANVGMKGHWEEELHGMDYLVYAYLQSGQDKKAKEQIDLLKSYSELSAVNGKSAYVFAATPARYVVERKQWADAARLNIPERFPWEKFPWEKSIIHFSRLLGSIQTNQVNLAMKELAQLKALQRKLADKNETYKANQVQIQVNSGEAWIKLKQGQKDEAIRLMTLAADMEDATGKHPVTPGEVVPARELLGDLLIQAGEPEKALLAYESNLKSHPNRRNGLHGAALAARKLNDDNNAIRFEQQLKNITKYNEDDQTPVVQTNNTH
jgi:hypothetical protein